MQDLPFITNSERMKEIISFLMRAAETDANILILGETGTGKEILAQSIHKNSRRKEMPLVTINCAAIPDTLLESELFGYKKGAFTDARDDKKGKIESANMGTLFLDEIADLSLPAQAKVLRLIENHELERLGDTKVINVDVRIIAATNTNLEECIKKGVFRADLFYRLNEVKVEIPPLRKRKEDIPLLIEYFIEEFNRELNKDVQGISSTAISFLSRYHFPGNVRELRSLIKRAMIVTRRKILWLEDLPIDIHILPDTFEEKQEKPTLKDWLEKLPIGIPLKPSLESDNLPTLAEMESSYIKEVLRRCGNNKSKAAKILGIDRTTLYQKLRKIT